METSKRMMRSVRVGDAAVEGLLSGILAGVVMALVIAGIEMLAGVSPLAALAYFDAGSSASPLSGAFTHIAISGMYGVVFGILALLIARTVGGREGNGLRLMMGALYGLLLFAIAEWVILPRTNSPLREMPLWGFASAHVIYGMTLSWWMSRKE